MEVSLKMYLQDILYFEILLKSIFILYLQDRLLLKSISHNTGDLPSLFITKQNFLINWKLKY